MMSDIKIETFELENESYESKADNLFQKAEEQTRISMKSTTKIINLDDLAEKISMYQKTIIILNEGDKNAEVITTQCNAKPPKNFKGIWMPQPICRVE